MLFDVPGEAWYISSTYHEVTEYQISFPFVKGLVVHNIFLDDKLLIPKSLARRLKRCFLPLSILQKASTGGGSSGTSKPKLTTGNLEPDFVVFEEHTFWSGFCPHKSEVLCPNHLPAS